MDARVICIVIADMGNAMESVGKIMLCRLPSGSWSNGMNPTVYRAGT